MRAAGAPPPGPASRALPPAAGPRAPRPGLLPPQARPHPRPARGDSRGAAAMSVAERPEEEAAASLGTRGAAGPGGRRVEGPGQRGCRRPAPVRPEAPRSATPCGRAWAPRWQARCAGRARLPPCSPVAGAGAGRCCPRALHTAGP